MDDKIFEKFSESARAILVSSQQLAESMNSPLGSEHVLLAIVLNRGTFANEILREYDVNLDQIKLILGLGQIQSTTRSGQLSDDVQSLLMNAMKLAAEYGHATVDAEHLLLAMATNQKQSAYSIIERIGVSPLHIKRQIETLFDEIAEIDQLVKREEKGSKKTGPKSKPKSKTPALDYFTLDLTRKAIQNELDPLIGRQKEINRTIQILSRRTKNNPVLIGEPGVGKTAIVEGLAQRIVNGQVPTHLLGKRLITLDLTAVIAGTMYRGQFEERIKKIIEEIKAAGNIILFVDEIHTVIGAGSAEGSLDAANILKPALTQGWIRLIGATTHDEYRKHIKKDLAFERRFQPIDVGEPSVEETVAILKGLRVAYEQHHRVKLANEALQAAAELSARYITEQFLPDKAIDLIDEAAAATHLSRDQETLGTSLSKKIARLNHEKDSAVLDENYQLASQLKEQIDKLQTRLTRYQQSKPTDDEPVITAAAIGALVGQMTGIPVAELLESERIRYQQLEQLLKSHVIGQDEAIAKVARAIRRSRTGVADPNRPIGSFMFLGPTGVGKTELAKILAREVFGSEKNLIKIDMSDFMERHNTSRLVGAPAGYVGYDDGGKLTEAIRHQPYSVVLFDEIEKAHPEVFNQLLQLLEEGQLADAKGQVVNFRNTIVIMTSNLGMAELTRQAIIGFTAESPTEEERAKRQYEAVKASVEKILKEQFRPEFLNRLDQTIIFQPLDKTAIRQITNLQLNQLAKRFEQLGHRLTIKARAIVKISQFGHNPADGARSLRRAISHHLETPLADYLLANDLSGRTTLTIDWQHNQFVIERRPARRPKTKTSR